MCIYIHTVVLNCVMQSASANCIFTVLEDHLHQSGNKLSCEQHLLRGASKKDFCYPLQAQGSSLATGVECRVKNNNFLTCLNDDTKPTQAFP